MSLMEKTPEYEQGRLFEVESADVNKEVQGVLELDMEGVNGIRRQTMEAVEETLLKPYASFSRWAVRRNPEKKDPYRTDYRRDRDRVMYSEKFRRMENKTQVTPMYSVDRNMRTRLTHTLEVAQVAKSLAGALGVNEDLAEAVALAHDLGHAPFGHRGQKAISEAMEEMDYPQFEHNEQACRIVEGEACYVDREGGFNLTNEVRYGLDKHGTYYQRRRRPVLEAQLADVADGIAYSAHDLGDALEAGVVSLEEVQELRIWKEVEQYGLKTTVNGREVTRAVINLLILDLVGATSVKLEEMDPQSAEDIEKCGEFLPRFSEETEVAMEELKDFLYVRYYADEGLQRSVQASCDKLKKLTKMYLNGEKELPVEVQVKGRELYEMVRDYVSGMTDKEAEEAIRDIVI